MDTSKAYFVILAVVAIVIFAQTETHGAQPITVPILNLYAPETSHYHSEEIYEAPDCSLLLMDVAKAIEFSNSKFSRREWTSDFLDERPRVAKEYADRSRYVVVKAQTSPLQIKRSDPIAATFGITYAKYSSSGGAGAPQDLIPVEKTLKLKALPRPKDPSGKGIIFELRTYAKDKVLGKGAFPILLGGGLNLIFSILADYPDLYDEPVLYTYGDELSVRFYQQLGFEVIKDIEPVEHDGTKWWVMVNTPKRLEALVARLNLERGVIINQALSVQIPGGKTVLAAPHTHIALGDGVPNSITLDQEAEILPGIFAAKGSRITFPSHPDDWQFQIAQIAKPILDKKNGVWIPTGSAVEISADSDVKGPLQSLETKRISPEGDLAWKNRFQKWWDQWAPPGSVQPSGRH